MKPVRNELQDKLKNAIFAAEPLDASLQRPVPMCYINAVSKNENENKYHEQKYMHIVFILPKKDVKHWMNIELDN